MKKYLTGYKLVFGLLGFSAVITEIATLMARGVFNPGNFFSFFTIESNILMAVVFICSALFTFAGKKSPLLDFFRGAAILYMIVTGIIFALLLAGIEGVTLTAVPWDNTVLHYIIPLAAVIDWIIDPPKKRISLRRAFIWLIFPIAYLVYSLLRGPIVNWYPYPFLDPANGGYEKIAITSLVITILGFALVFVLTRFPRRAK